MEYGACKLETVSREVIRDEKDVETDDGLRRGKQHITLCRTKHTHLLFLRDSSRFAFFVDMVA